MTTIVANTSSIRRSLYVQLRRKFTKDTVVEMREFLVSENPSASIDEKEVIEFLKGGKGWASVRTEEIIAWEIDTEAVNPMNHTSSHIRVVTASGIVPLDHVFVEAGDLWTYGTGGIKVDYDNAVLRSFCEQLHAEGWLDVLFPRPPIDPPPSI